MFDQFIKEIIEILSYYQSPLNYAFLLYEYVISYTYIYV